MASSGFTTCGYCQGRDHISDGGLSADCARSLKQRAEQAERERDEARAKVVRLKKALAEAALPLEVLVLDADENGCGTIAPQVVTIMRGAIMRIRAALEDK